MTDASAIHRLAAVLSTDVVGYSAHMSGDENLTDQVVARALTKRSAIVVQSQGRVAQTAGDGFIAVFDSALSALSCGIEMAKSTGEADAIHGQPLRFRTGLTLGEIIHRGTEVYGDAVNIAKRLEQEAEPDWICVSRALYEQVRNKCNCGFEFLGPRSLKNIPDLIDVYRVLENPTVGILAPAKRAALPALPPMALPSIAVLPLTDLTEDATKAWLCDGIAEEIIAGLSRFKDLFVISRNSSFLMKGLDVNAADVGRQLGVRYLLLGSIRSVKDRVRMTVQLTAASSHSTLWAETYEGSLTNVFDLEDEVTSAIAGVLHGRIEEAEFQQVSRGRTSESAYSLLVRAKAHYRSLVNDGFDEAKRLCRQAIAADPGFGSAWAFLSQIRNTQWRYSTQADRDELLRESEECARKALMLDDTDAQAHAELGCVYLYQKKVSLAIAEYERALALNPNDADIMAESADALQYAGRAEEAVKLMERAMRLNPFYPDSYLWNLADAYFALGRYEDIITTVNQMHNPSEGRRLLAASYALLGRIDEARTQAAEVLRTHPDFSVRLWSEVQPDVVPDVLAKFGEGLRLAGLPD